MQILTWTRGTRAFESGLNGAMGKFKCFYVSWDAGRTKGSATPPYRLTTILPGLKSTLGHFATEEKAQARAELVATYWITEAGLEASQLKQDKELEEVLNADHPWPLRDVLLKLASAADILLDEHSYDGHGHEEIREAREVGRALALKIKKGGA